LVIIGFHLFPLVNFCIYSRAQTSPGEQAPENHVSSVLLREWKKLYQKKSNKKGSSIKSKPAALIISMD